MKNLRFIFFAFVFMISSAIIAQNKSDGRKQNDKKDKIEKAEKKRDKAYLKMNKKRNGNAYGIHKFGKEGREYGQYRAWMARNKAKNDRKFNDLSDIINKRKVKDGKRARSIIDLKRMEIEELRKERKISIFEYAVLKKDLDYAESDLESFFD